MNRLKLICLTIILAIGFTLPGCESEDPCNFDIPDYFDIEGISGISYTDFLNGSVINNQDIISFTDLDLILINYEVSYVASNYIFDWTSGIMSSAYACSPPLPGGLGSKEERLIEFKITTLNDFDADHLADSSINDLFEYYGSSMVGISDEPIPLTQYIEEQTENIQEEDIFLKLKKAPEINKELKLRVRVELSTEEVYEFETTPFFINS